VRIINRKVVLLQQFLPVVRPSSSEFFIFQQGSALAHTALEAINFSHSFVEMLSDFKILSKQTQQ